MKKKQSKTIVELYATYSGISAPAIYQYLAEGMPATYSGIFVTDINYSKADEWIQNNKKIRLTISYDLYKKLRGIEAGGSVEDVIKELYNCYDTF